MEKHCPSCTCDKQPPDYPVTCDLCGIAYGPGGEVGTHRPGGDACVKRQRERDKARGLVPQTTTK